jgi:ATP-dependent DNA ligase
MVEAGEDFVPRVEEFRPEGVVAKPFGSTYIPGRRRSAW